jgi:hypothetical protein
MATSNTSFNNENKKMNDVLFQKLGNTWYIFTEVKGEVVYSVLPEGMDPHTTKLELYEVIENHMKKVASNHKRNPDMAA